LSNRCTSIFLNTPIRRHQKRNVTAENRLLDVWPYFPGERPELVGEKLLKAQKKTAGTDYPPLKKAFCINFKSNCINFKHDLFLY